MARTRTTRYESDAEKYRRFTLREPRAPNPYVAFVGLDGMSVPALVEKLEQGLPFNAFERLRTTLGLTAGDLAKVVGIPARTLVRRKSERRLARDESDRLARGMSGASTGWIADTPGSSFRRVEQAVGLRASRRGWQAWG